MELFNDHRKLFGLAFGLFVTLSLFVAVLPALYNQRNNAPLPGALPMEGEVLAGKEVFIANGCVSCHSQQVRNIDMDRVWGSRPGIAADYAASTRTQWWMNAATLMGTERTGPDLTNVGNRLPAADWHLLHLYNPRLVVDASVMPAYPWLFEWKEKADAGDKVVRLPPGTATGGRGELVATREALQLVAYLQSLKQTPLPDGSETPAFLYRKEEATAAAEDGSLELNGADLYAANCQACHQAGGQGLPGAFPPLKGSPIVQSDDPSTMVEIIMKGYDANDQYGQMPPVGKLNGLTAAEIAAIINHERSNWGNDAPKVPVAEVEKILDYLQNENENL